MRLLLDTNVLLWTLTGHPRIEPVRQLILAQETEIFVSTVSLWEVATTASIGKLAADVSEIRGAIATSGFLELPVLGEHTETLAKLPLHHRDPFDRMIVAQAITEPMRLLTGDSQLAVYSDLVKTV
jgi:PIN domain nuclease of toxin-antitoxin system